MSDREQLPGFPQNELDQLIEQARINYEEQVEEHGPGKNWLQDEARWHIWKACDELFQARDHANAHRYEPAMRHFGDALNHMLFAAEIVHQFADEPHSNEGDPDA